MHIDRSQLSRDTLFSGDVICLQKKDGYRYSVDAILLAHFVSPRPRDVVLDMGAGCGIISLILAYRWPFISIFSLEIQDSLIPLIHNNIHENNFQDRINLVRGDFTCPESIIPVESCDLVVCNPPYRTKGSGRLNPHDEQCCARHEILGDLRQCVAAVSFVLKNKGRAAFVYPASRAGTLLGKLKVVGLEPKRLQIVYSYPGAVGKLVLVEAVKNGGEELMVLPPFYIFKRVGGPYSPEMAQYYLANKK